MRRMTIFGRLLTFGLVLLPVYAADQQVPVDDAEHEAFMRDANKRREAFERYGVVPKVPDSLSTNPDDPDFVFLGFSRYATPEEAEEAMIHSRAPSVFAEENRSPDQDLGVFISAGGEMWGWRPRDRSRTIDRAKALLRLPASAQEVPAFQGSGLEDRSDADTGGSGKQENSQRQAIIFNDNRAMRSSIVGSCMTCFPLRAIGALEPDGQPTNSPSARCTATKIGPRHLITAAHCVHTGVFGALMQRDWWPGQDGANGIFGSAAPNGARNIQWYWIPSRWKDFSDPNRDFAILILFDTAANANLGWFGYKVDSNLAGDSTRLYGYPGWGNTCANSALPNNSCGNSMWGMTSTINWTSDAMAYYSHDTQPGQSGSAVYDYNNGNRQIVAVHKGAYTPLENRGVKVNLSVYTNIITVVAAYPSSF